MTNTRTRLLQLVALSILTTVLATDARADDPVDTAVAHMGVGAGISFTRPSNSDGQSSDGAAFVYRWHTFHSGWGPSFGLDWRSTDYNGTLGALNAPLGTLRTRAILGGYGHTKRLGRFSTSASMNAGYSFNDFSMATVAGSMFANAGVSLLGVSVDNSWILKPEVSAWYDIFRHIGIGVSAAYIVSRPNETVTTAIGSETQHLRADAFELTAGLTFGVWKKR